MYSVLPARMPGLKGRPVFGAFAGRITRRAFAGCAETAFCHTVVSAMPAIRPAAPASRNVKRPRSRFIAIPFIFHWRRGPTGTPPGRRDLSLIPRLGFIVFGSGWPQALFPSGGRLRGRTQDQLLHAPVGGFSHVDFVLRRAR